jgi:hypothetical protein
MFQVRGVFLQLRILSLEAAHLLVRSFELVPGYLQFLVNPVVVAETDVCIGWNCTCGSIDVEWCVNRGIVVSV